LIRVGLAAAAVGITVVGVIYLRRGGVVFCMRPRPHAVIELGCCGFLSRRSDPSTCFALPESC